MVEIKQIIVKIKTGDISGIKIIGTDDDLRDIYKSGIDNALITVGSMRDNTKRYELFKMVKKFGFIFPIIISQEAIIDESIKIGEGTIIMPGSIINIDSSIGKNCIINTGSIIEHDCKIGNIKPIFLTILNSSYLFVLSLMVPTVISASCMPLL